MASDHLINCIHVIPIYQHMRERAWSAVRILLLAESTQEGMQIFR